MYIILLLFFFSIYILQALILQANWIFSLNPTKRTIDLGHVIAFFYVTGLRWKFFKAEDFLLWSSLRALHYTCATCNVEIMYFNSVSSIY